jgi:hypothetical protein
MKIEEILDSMDYGKAPEDTSPALKWLDAHDWTIRAFINGDFVTHDKPEYFDSINPATGERLAQIQASTQSDIDAAVKAAKKAQLRVWFKSIHACLPSLKVWTMVSQSARAAILMFHLLRATFIIMRDGHSLWNTSCLAWNLSALWGR